MMETRQCSPLILPDSASGAWVDENFSPSNARLGDPPFLVVYIVMSHYYRISISFRLQTFTVCLPITMVPPDTFTLETEGVSKKFAIFCRHVICDYGLVQCQRHKILQGLRWTPSNLSIVTMCL